MEVHKIDIVIVGDGIVVLQVADIVVVSAEELMAENNPVVAVAVVFEEKGNELAEEVCHRVDYMMKSLKIHRLKCLLDDTERSLDHEAGEHGNRGRGHGDLDGEKVVGFARVVLIVTLCRNNLMFDGKVVDMNIGDS
jgi:hypothetical protein